MVMDRNASAPAAMAQAFSQEADLSFAAKAAVLAALTRSAAEVDEKFFTLRAELARAKEIARSEHEEEVNLLRQMILERDTKLACERAEAQAQMQALRDAAEKDRARAVLFEQKMMALYKSTSWRITAPLRALMSALRGRRYVQRPK